MASFLGCLLHMASFLGCLLHLSAHFALAASSSHAGSSGISQASAANYEAFLREHGETRVNDTVSYARRLALFQRTLHDIEKQNSDPNANWFAGLNRFADYTESEFRALLGHQPGLRGLATAGAVSAGSSSPTSSFIQAGPHHRGITATRINIDALAKSVDWREKLSTPVEAKDQGSCGSCWAVAAAGAIEAYAEKTIGMKSTVSYEQLVDCVPNPMDCGGTGGCKGATSELAFEWIHKYGIVAEGDYSGYKSGREGNCMRTSKPILKATGFFRLAENQYGPLLQAVAEQGPVVVSVDAGGWGNYRGGVFDSCPRAAKVNHAVLLVGYGHDDRRNKDFWLVRNSWGPRWGEKGGFIRILRHSAGNEDMEAGYCGEDPDPSAGVACKGPDGKYPKTLSVCGMCGILSDSSYPIGLQSGTKVAPGVTLAGHSSATVFGSAASKDFTWVKNPSLPVV